MFLLVILHNVFNRRWYGVVRAAGRKPAGRFDLLVTALLLVTMLALLATSILISNALSGLMSSLGGFTIRQIHTLAAYWAMIIVSIHLGLRWPLIMARIRHWLGLRSASTMQRWALRCALMAIAVQGVHSFSVLGLGTKLSMQVSLDWWNFEESVAGFFGHCLAVSGLCIAASYHLAKVLRMKDAPSAPMAQRVDHQAEGR
nr:DUF4405 domain-containing protein [Roseomonas sp. GC11]